MNAPTDVRIALTLLVLGFVTGFWAQATGRVNAENTSLFVVVSAVVFLVIRLIWSW